MYVTLPPQHIHLIGERFLMVWLHKGGGSTTALFLADWIFREKNDAMEKNFLKCVSNSFFYVLPQKLIFWVKRIMQHVTFVGAVVDCTHSLLLYLTSKVWKTSWVMLMTGREVIRVLRKCDSWPLPNPILGTILAPAGFTTCHIIRYDVIRPEYFHLLSVYFETTRH